MSKHKTPRTLAFDVCAACDASIASGEPVRDVLVMHFSGLDGKCATCDGPLGEGYLYHPVRYVFPIANFGEKFDFGLRYRRLGDAIGRNTDPDYWAKKAGLK
jgi:hypothetical protein